MRILAVDDDEVSRRALACAITEAAPLVELVVCENAEEVLALPDADCFDVAFVGIDNPDMNGIGLARELKSFNPRVNIVFASKHGEYMADAFKMHSSGYLMKPITTDAVAAELENLRFPPVMPDAERGDLFVRCFGNFEVFANGHALAFERTKTKELLAFLVDRRGAIVTLREAEAVIWEGAPPSAQISGSYLRTLVADLRRTLSACGHGDVLVRRRGELGVDATRFTCDYYDFLHREPLAINLWRGEYMVQYAWADATAAALMRDFPEGQA